MWSLHQACRVQTTGNALDVEAAWPEVDGSTIVTRTGAGIRSMSQSPNGPALDVRDIRLDHVSIPTIRTRSENTAGPLSHTASDALEEEHMPVKLEFRQRVIRQPE